jgi:hypothetical protein
MAQIDFNKGLLFDTNNKLQDALNYFKLSCQIMESYFLEAEEKKVQADEELQMR